MKGVRWLNFTLPQPERKAESRLNATSFVRFSTWRCTHNRGSLVLLLDERGRCVNAGIRRDDGIDVVGIPADRLEDFLMKHLLHQIVVRCKRVRSPQVQEQFIPTAVRILIAHTTDYRSTDHPYRGLAVAWREHHFVGQCADHNARLALNRRKDSTKPPYF